MGTTPIRGRLCNCKSHMALLCHYANPTLMGVTNDTDFSAKVRRLTPRQIECLRLVYDRRTSKEIAAEIELSAATVDSYITDAVALLGARNRRHAAELLHSVAPPEKLGSQSSGAEDPPFPIQAPARRQFRWSDWLPFRQLGANGNDFHPAIRILFIPVLAVVFATGFGMLANGARVVSDLFAAWLR
jgi:DNA-binding CsgD family transcriptional regulator